MRKIKLNEKGFMIIIAMIMFAIMSYYAISALKTNIQLITNTKNTNLYYRATHIANSMMEYLQYTVKKEHTSGYNLDKECNYGKYAVGKPENDPLCNEVMEGLLQGDGNSDNVKVKLTIKGRSNDGTNGKTKEQFTNCNIGGLGDCYVIPFPGTGDAGKRCKFYEPDFTGVDSAKKLVSHMGQIIESSACTSGEGKGCINQLDYSCNWNKLKFGSTLLDRAVIPFYYDSGRKDANGNIKIENPFENGGNFVLRVRTPCKPCEGTACNSSKDPTICRDAQIGDRYELDDENGDNAVTNDTVVQWQLTGKCGQEGKEDEEECGLIQYKDLRYLDDSSAITESRINNGDRLDLLRNHVVLYNTILGSSQGVDTNTYSETKRPYVIDKLRSWTKPILALFLGEKLKTAPPDNDFIPYLEYQVLTDTPIANPKIQMDVFVSVDGIGAKKTMYKYEQKQLIDFAIQN